MPLTGLGLVLVHATMIAVRGTDVQCPTGRQVTEALGARLPGVLVPEEQAKNAGALLLTLSQGSDGAAGFVLVDQKGGVRLRRALVSAGSTTKRDCPALAETAALMVERYLQDLSVQERGPPPAAVVVEPAPRPPERRWDLFGGGTWRPGSAGLAAYELRLGAARSLGTRERLALGATVGIEGASPQTWEGGSGRLRRFPVEVRLLWRLTSGIVGVEAGPFAGAHVLLLDSDAGAMGDTALRAIPVVGGLGTARIPVGRRVFLRLVAAVGIAMVRYDFVTPQPKGTVAFGTERTYGKMGLEAGLSFW
jgi:hypothetical protein